MILINFLISGIPIILICISVSTFLIGIILIGIIYFFNEMAV